MMNRQRIFRLPWMFLCSRFWGSPPRSDPAPLQLEPLPSGPRQRLARLLAISGCITVVGCFGGKGEATACPPGYQDLWDNGAVCVDVDECSNAGNRCASSQSCENTPGAYVCVVTLPRPGECGPTGVRVAFDGTRRCARPLDSAYAGTGTDDARPNASAAKPHVQISSL